MKLPAGKIDELFRVELQIRTEHAVVREFLRKATVGIAVGISNEEELRFDAVFPKRSAKTGPLSHEIVFLKVRSFPSKWWDSTTGK